MRIRPPGSGRSPLRSSPRKATETASRNELLFAPTGVSPKNVQTVEIVANRGFTPSPPPANRREGGRNHSRWGTAALVFINGFVTIALLALVAMATRIPFVFPSLGPTAFLLFFVPGSPYATPRRTIFGHALGILCGYGALWLCGLQHAPSAMLEGIGLYRVLAAALSLASTGALMILCDAVHPPAGATTLIISLGLIVEPFHLLIIEVAVVLMVLQAALINRLEPLLFRRRAR